MLANVKQQEENFNPRAHEGHDHTSSQISTQSLFQSTCPRGARLSRE